MTMVIVFLFFSNMASDWLATYRSYPELQIICYVCLDNLIHLFVYLQETLNESCVLLLAKSFSILCFLGSPCMNIESIVLPALISKHDLVPW